MTFKYLKKNDPVKRHELSDTEKMFFILENFSRADVDIIKSKYGQKNLLFWCVNFFDSSYKSKAFLFSMDAPEKHQVSQYMDFCSTENKEEAPDVEVVKVSDEYARRYIEKYLEPGEIGSTRKTKIEKMLEGDGWEHQRCFLGDDDFWEKLSS